jgi:hypothetical protein
MWAADFAWDAVGLGAFGFGQVCVHGPGTQTV